MNLGSEGTSASTPRFDDDWVDVAFAGHQAVAFDKPRPGVQGECAMTNAARTRVSESPPISALMTVIAILILPL